MVIKDLFILLALGAFTHPAFAQVVAKVGKADITLESFKRKYADVRNQTINPPSNPEDFLDDLIRFEMGVQEAEKQNLIKDPIVKERIRQELYKALVEKEIGAQVAAIKITDAEMRDFYAKNPEIRSSQILIQIKRGASKEDKKKALARANEIFKEVKASSRSFEELVKLYSDDTLGKNTGGDLGFHNRITAAASPEFYETLLRTKTNEIAGPVLTVYGYHIIKVTERRAFKDADQTQIRAALFDVKRKALFDAYFKKLGPRYPVTKNSNLIKSVE